jgi:hypothetical protein
MSATSDFAVRPLPTPEQPSTSQSQKLGAAMSWHGGTAFDPQQTQLVSPQQTSPPATSPNDNGAARKRKRSSAAVENGTPEVGGEAGHGFEGSPMSTNGNKQRHQPGVKRACNDCRQQKVCLHQHWCCALRPLDFIHAAMHSPSLTHSELD